MGSLVVWGLENDGAVVRACWSGAERMAEKQTGYRLSVALSQLGQGMEREETNQWGSHENSVNE